jgi:hypothetical protein
MKTKIIKLLILPASVFFLGACSKLTSNSGADSPVVADELAECLTSTSYSPSVTITGTASFYKRGLTVSQAGGLVTSMTLSTPITIPLPIKFAEVRVLNSAGTLVQCGITNVSGALKALDGTSNLVIPNAAGSYSVQVLARSNHLLTVPGGKTAFKIYTSVKSDIYSNSVYTLASTVASTGSGSFATTLTAYARESQSSVISGGAFNIYNDIFTTYDYLAQNTSTSDLTCLNPKLHVYWKAGFNPAQYVYPDANPSDLGTLSFYVRGANQLYINGGQLGNVSSVDTDHFDDTVIIHETGHHIEDVCGKMDSPGGTHYGLYRIDPRLAWSEGWGNFFGAHQVRNSLASVNPDLGAQLPASGWLYYLDTQGYSDSGAGTASEYIRLNLNKAGNNPESVSTSNGTRYYDKVDATTKPGEGLYRETSISRSLFKIANNCTGCANSSFANIWQAFEKNPSGVGMGKSIYPFRSAARFYSRLNQSYAGSMPGAIDTILNSDEAQQRETNASYTVGGYQVYVPYATKLVASGAPCPLKIQPRQDSGVDANYLSDQRYSNHFYFIDISSLSGVTSIKLNSTYVAGTTSIDIDSILYSEGYTYDNDCAAYFTNGQCQTAQKISTGTNIVRADRSVGNGTKTISLVGLNASTNYLLNIRAYTTNILPAITAATEYSYTLTDQSGGYLCPASPY